jgi:Sulfotransferase domain
MIETVKRVVKSVSNVHRPDGSPNVFLFSTPRSGSTWLMEWIWSQPGFKYCNEPLNLREPQVRRHLGISRWEDLFGEAATPKLSRYFAGFCDGRLRFANPNPLRTYYRPVTHRIVFKEIHAGVDRVNWFRDTFNGRIVFLLRHPIAVALSTEELPTLPAFLHSDYRRRFSHEEIERATEIADAGTDLERRVLSWCLQNAVPLRAAMDDWAIVTYEQMVLDPDPVIESMADALALPLSSRIRDQLEVASGVKEKSDTATRRVLEGGESSKRPWLVEKWRARVEPAEERRVMRILELFGLDAYRSGEVLPADRFWMRLPVSRPA